MTDPDAVVILLQHGEKEPTPGDPGLTARGLDQARAAAARLAAVPAGALAASPLRRARQTIAPLAELTGLAVAVDERLAERMNLAPGQDPAAFLREWARTVKDRDWRPAGGRSSRATGAAMLAALDDHAVAGAVVVLATHGGATVDLLRSLLGDAELERRAPGLVAAGVPAGALTTLRRDGGRWGVVAIGDTAHLAADAR